MTRATARVETRAAYDALMRDLLQRAAARIAQIKNAAGDEPAAKETTREDSTRASAPQA